MTYVGELGWELYVPVAQATTVYDAIIAEGGDRGLRHAGFHAMDSLRLEAGYRHWGHDLTDQDTPLEAGLGFAVSHDKPGGFIGRDALARQRQDARTRRLVQFRLEDPDRLLYHDEPIYRDGELVGRTSSGAWSYTQDRALAMGYVACVDGVDAAYVAEGSWEIEVACERVPASASLRSFYDPASQRPRS
jgi:glycine cleavage system aminomethyltransferase T